MKDILVTGGSKGIGRAICVELARCGCRVIVNYRSHADDANQVVQQIKNIGGEAIAHQADVADQAAVEAMIERVQAYEGVVIASSGGSARAMFTVRKVSYGVGVERIFPLHSPNIEKIEVSRAGKVRRAKLYYLRGRRGKAARIKERRTQ